MRIALQIPLTLGEIREMTGGAYDGDPARRITHIVTDSREAEKDDLFLALRGENSDGADFVADLNGRGIVSLSERATPGAMLVPDAEKAVVQLASRYAARLPELKHTVAVTGSVGKTTTKEMLSRLLNGRRIHKTPGNFNNALGVPLTVFGAPADTEVLLLEFGMNHAGEIRALAEAMMPDIGIITGIGSAHIGNLGSKQAIADAKEELLYAVPPSALYVPDSDIFLQKTDGRKKASLSDKRADTALIPLAESEKETQLLFYRRGTRIGTFTVPFSGRHLLTCLALALAVAARLGEPDDGLIERASSLPLSLLRSQTNDLGDLSLTEDYYNASPESVEAALDALAWYDRGRRCVLLGDMRELGSYTEEEHRKIGGSLVKHGVEECYLIGSYAPFYARGAKDAGMPTPHIHVNTDPTAPETTVRQILDNRRPADRILCKASRAVHLENVVSLLREELLKRSDMQ